MTADDLWKDARVDELMDKVAQDIRDKTNAADVKQGKGDGIEDLRKADWYINRVINEETHNGQ